jgi:hypothetical protein
MPNSTPPPWEHDPVERVATSVTAGAHVAWELWPDVQDDQRVLNVVMWARDLFNALWRADPPAADVALHNLDTARSLIPNGNNEGMER